MNLGLSDPETLKAIYLYGDFAEAMVRFGFAIRFIMKTITLPSKKPDHSHILIAAQPLLFCIRLL